MNALQNKIEETARELARQSVRAAALEQALKGALLDAATSPVALLVAFGSGAVLGLASSTSNARRHRKQPEDSAEEGQFKALLQRASSAANWITVIPVIVGVWESLRSGTAATAPRTAAREN